MRPGKYHLLLSAALLQVCAVASGSPLPTVPETAGLSAVSAWTPMTTEQLARTDAQLETSPAALAFGSASTESAAFSLTGLLDGMPDLGASDRGLREQLRGFINIGPDSRGAGPAAGGQARSAPTSPWLSGIDGGAAADEWLRDTMQSLVQSTLRLETNERGRASFSIFGMGDFSVTMSGDRSQLALSEGDDVLLVAQRVPAHEAGGAGNHAVQSQANFPFAGDSANGLQDRSALRQAIDLVIDLASHPVSLLVYCITTAYLLLWSVLSHDRKKKRSRPRTASPASEAIEMPAPAPRRKRRHRVRIRLPATDIARTGRTGHAHVVPTDADPAGEAAPVRQRKRIRIKVRMRMRTRKPATSGRA